MLGVRDLLKTFHNRVEDEAVSQSVRTSLRWPDWSSVATCERIRKRDPSRQLELTGSPFRQRPLLNCSNEVHRGATFSCAQARVVSFCLERIIPDDFSRASIKFRGSVRSSYAYSSTCDFDPQSPQRKLPQRVSIPTR